MIIKIGVFELCNGKYKNLSEVAQAMGILVSNVYRVREGRRNINQKLIIRAIKAFPECTFGDLSYLVPEPQDGNINERTYTIIYHHQGSAIPPTEISKSLKVKVC